jgi:hypothetical protein
MRRKNAGKGPPGTPLGRKTAVKKNARWRIPEKNRKIRRKRDPFGGKTSENRRETPVRKNLVCAHIYGASGAQGPPGGALPTVKPECFERFHFRGFRANTVKPHDSRSPGSKVTRKTRGFRVAANRTHRKTPAMAVLGASPGTRKRTIFERPLKKRRENACLRAGGRKERP